VAVPTDPTRNPEADIRANERAIRLRLAEDRARSREERLRMTLDVSATLLKLANAPRRHGSPRA
jgi:hypothetical protein